MNALNNNAIYYLASPYSHTSPLVREIRYVLTGFVAATLAKKGINLIEPIGMCHPHSQIYDLHTGYEAWQKRDRALIEKSDGVIALILPGWAESVGVTDEVCYATSLDKPIYYISLEEIASEEELTELRKIAWN